MFSVPKSLGPTLEGEYLNSKQINLNRGSVNRPKLTMSNNLLTIFLFLLAPVIFESVTKLKLGPACSALDKV
jgi:hypothetical protein